ncbi:phosphopantetheine-binding protein [Salinisphaera sp. LB1]|uniref:phosphopantetheine-binding protein n=1 Tax=Salinisphaera sp. LB1 TaxID=2183911 RepID=UPI000D7086E6|nr:phosphopantetheine-binding protein [Salinisphaera sp. LB1]AWN17482.1 Acyl carrier protein (ACP1) [Salinisphaera sp. LB1]
MSEQSDLERDVAQLLVTSLDLDDVAAAEIEPTAPLFGPEADGLGLDSIDALEIALAVNQAYGIELRADDEANSRIFATLRSLSAHIERERAEA